MKRTVNPSSFSSTAASVAPEDPSTAAHAQQAPDTPRPASPRQRSNASLLGLQRAGSRSPRSTNRSAVAGAGTAATSAAPAPAAAAAANAGANAAAAAAPANPIPTTPEAFFAHLEQWAAAADLSPAEKAGRKAAADRISDAFEHGSTDLKLNDLSLSSLPEGMSLMTDLRELSVRNNNLQALTDLPPQLEVLSVTGNRLAHLDALPPRLQDLSASHNQLSELPELPRTLESLNVVGNHLTQVPHMEGRIFHAALGNNRFANLRGMPNTLRYLSVEPRLIAATIAELGARVATLGHGTDLYSQQHANQSGSTAASASQPAQARTALPGPFGRLNAESAEAVLANLAPDSPEIHALAQTSVGFHQQLQPRIDAARELEALDAEIALLRDLQQMNRP